MFNVSRNSGNKDKKRVVVSAGLWKYFFAKKGLNGFWCFPGLSCLGEHNKRFRSYFNYDRII